MHDFFDKYSKMEDDISRHMWKSFHFVKKVGIFCKTHPGVHHTVITQFIWREALVTNLFQVIFIWYPRNSVPRISCKKRGGSLLLEVKNWKNKGESFVFGYQEKVTKKRAGSFMQNSLTYSCKESLLGIK